MQGSVVAHFKWFFFLQITNEAGYTRDYEEQRIKMKLKNAMHFFVFLHGGLKWQLCVSKSNSKSNNRGNVV